MEWQPLFTDAGWPCGESCTWQLSTLAVSNGIERKKLEYNITSHKSCCIMSISLCTTVPTVPVWYYFQSQETRGIGSNVLIPAGSDQSSCKNKNFILVVKTSSMFQCSQILYCSPSKPYFYDLVVVSYSQITRPLAAFKVVLENNIS